MSSGTDVSIQEEETGAGIESLVEGRADWAPVHARVHVHCVRFQDELPYSSPYLLMETSWLQIARI